MTSSYSATTEEGRKWSEPAPPMGLVRDWGCGSWSLRSGALFVFCFFFFGFMRQNFIFLSQLSARPKALAREGAFKPKRLVGTAGATAEAAALRDCVLHPHRLNAQLSLERDAFDKLPAIVNTCAQHHLNEVLGRKLVRVRAGAGSVWHFVPLAKAALTSVMLMEPCFLLLAGTRDHLMAAKAFDARYPECQMLGTEPVNETEASELTEALRTPIIPFGVGQDAGDPATISLAQVIEEYIREPTLHFVLFDSRGNEWGTLLEFEAGKSLGKKEPVVCQMDAVMYREEEFGRRLSSLLLNTPLLPVHAEDRGPDRKTLTLINVNSSKCQQWFNYRKFFTLEPT